MEGDGRANSRAVEAFLTSARGGYPGDLLSILDPDVFQRMATPAFLLFLPVS
ncbi:hypothetical protein ABGB12_12430 [Actinocorallia sp. B10E7]|uniref:hypothetical protein n=1 Tax=Actinocorallia sp. B10E7 TaxID=3153558 RepID=UPI00325E7726